MLTGLPKEKKSCLSHSVKSSCSLSLWLLTYGEMSSLKLVGPGALQQPRATRAPAAMLETGHLNYTRSFSAVSSPPWARLTPASPHNSKRHSLNLTQIWDKRRRGPTVICKLQLWTWVWINHERHYGLHSQRLIGLNHGVCSVCIQQPYQKLASTLCLKVMHLNSGLDIKGVQCK